MKAVLFPIFGSRRPGEIEYVFLCETCPKDPDNPGPVFSMQISLAGAKEILKKMDWFRKMKKSRGVSRISFEETPPSSFYDGNVWTGIDALYVADVAPEMFMVEDQLYWEGYISWTENIIFTAALKREHLLAIANGKVSVPIILSDEDPFVGENANPKEWLSKLDEADKGVRPHRFETRILMELSLSHEPPVHTPAKGITRSRLRSRRRSTVYGPRSTR